MRSAPPLQFLAATLSADSASMSSLRPPYRGSNNRNQWGRRTSSNSPNTQDSNLGFGNGEANQNFTPRPSPQPPWRYYQNQQFRPPPQQPSYQNQHIRQSSPLNQNQNRQSFNHNYRPQRPAKPLDYRNWEYAKTAPPRDCDKFIVLSYNILADYLAINHRSKLYYHIPRHMLDWEWRKRNIIFELGLWSADIMCFQEVDRFGDLEKELKVRGYNGIWKMRTGNAIDGCAVFWRTSRFKLLYEESIEFSKHGLRDNVAQICVLEQLIRHPADLSTVSTSSTSSNKVLICNIHVLYNPKRGEIKLGQVRMLLDWAYAVSKTWNDAPVVLCGDFNCTPKSPLYNFILEQKLDFSGIDRDKVSGQASAEIRTSRPYNSGCNPNASPGTQSSDNSFQAPITVDSKQSDSLPDMQKQNNQHESLENVPSFNDYSKAQDTRIVQDALDVSVGSELHVEETKEILQKEVEQSSTICHSEGKLAVGQMSDEMHKSTSPLTSHPEDAYSDEREQRGEENSAYLLNQVVSCEPSRSHIYTENIRTKFDNLEVSTSGSSAYLSSPPIVNDENADLSTSYQANISDASINISYVGDKLPGDASPRDLNNFFPESRTIGEDQSTFLSELHGVEGSLPQDLNYSLQGFASDPNDSQLHSPDEEVLDDFPLGLDSEGHGVEKTAYDPSSWTPIEIETASGNADCTFVEHPLKLKSTYAQVEDRSGTRDPNGEPLVTSYNRCFLGTVDYVWCSEDLQTVKVLAPIPKHAMQWTPGFPTKKWGSDHIALASELAFTNDASNNNREVQ